MNQLLNSLIRRLMPFIGCGVALVVLCVAVILFSYVFMVGALIGLIFFAIASVRSYFMRKRALQQRHSGQTVWQSYFESQDSTTARGRVYDQDGNEG